MQWQHVAAYQGEWMQCGLGGTGGQNWQWVAATVGQSVVMAAAGEAAGGAMDEPQVSATAEG